MKSTLTIFRSYLVATLFGLWAWCSVSAAWAQSSELEGTWRLVMRELPDGKKILPPDVLGLSSYANGHKNQNVVWRTPDGKVASLSGISMVKLTENEYSETVLYSRLVDPSNPQGMLLNVSGETKIVPLKREGGRIQYKLPFAPPMVVVDGDKITATAEGAFTDHWERVK
jgi:hypothetical protein